MATEIGGAQLGIVIGDGSGADPDQFNAISQFFQGYYSTQTAVTPSQATQPGEQVIVTDLGRTLYTFDSATAPTIKFKGNADGAVGTGSGNTIKAGDGDNDIIITDNAAKTVNLGAGNDFLQATGSGSVTVNAGSGDDSVVGSSSSDNIKGGSGSDYLQGKGGNDIINGGNGKDVIAGGADNDTMTGGNGNDIFIIGKDDTGVDLITDFKKGDILQIVDRNGDAAGVGVETIVHNTELNTITVTIQGGETVILEKIKDKQDLQDNGDGTFSL
jgi:Ca2+-binding RTX toxin-like protein